MRPVASKLTLLDLIFKISYHNKYVHNSPWSIQGNESVA